MTRKPRGKTNPFVRVIERARRHAGRDKVLGVGCPLERLGLERIPVTEATKKPKSRPRVATIKRRNKAKRSHKLDLKTLKKTPPWDWPQDTETMLVDILRNRRAAERDRLQAAELCGDLATTDVELVDSLLSILRSDDEPVRLRCRAALSLGPIFEYIDTEGFEEPGEAPDSERRFHEVQKSLRKLFTDAGTPENLRRQILETSARAPRTWHRDAIRAAYSSGDQVWKRTAVFCMRFVKGFKKEIIAELESENPDIRYEAVCAAGAWSMEAAWPHIAAIVTSGETDKYLQLAAIEAVASIRPEKAEEILGDLIDSEDEDIVEAAYEAMAMADVLPEEDEEDGGFRF